MKRQVQILQLDDISLKLKQLHFIPLNYGVFHYVGTKVLKNTFLPFYRICMVTKGNFRIERGKFSYPLFHGDLILVRPNTLYSAYTSEEESDFYYLDFKFEYQEDEDEFNNLFEIQDVLRIRNLLNERQIQNLHHLNLTVQINHPGTYLLVEGMLIRIFIVMLKRMNEEEKTFLIKEPQNAKEVLLLECTQYIDEHISEKLTVRSIAKQFNYSENYIYKIFQDTLHVSTQSYILNHRLSKAIQDLKSTQKSVSEIATNYGFSSVYHFSNAFKKKYGYSPLNYRKDHEF